MKKTLSLVLSLVMVLSVLTAIPFTAHAITEYSYTQDSSLGGNTFRYTLSGNEATITGFTALSAGTTDKSITIPSIMNGNTVVEIGEAVFNENENIESVSIPASVKTINSYAFNLCFGLSSVTFASDSELITIGEAAFASTAISSITFPSKLQYIAKDAFEYCENLTSVTIPNSTKTIFGGAFANCTNLSTVTIGSKVSNIKSGAFTGCVALSSISVDSANETYSSASGVLYNKDKTTLILYPQGKSNTGFELRDETTTIADYAFEGNTALQQLLINSDSSLVSIGVGAFRGCSSLKSIMDIPDSLTTIGDEAFKGVANNLYVQSACDHPLVASAIIQGVSTRTWDMNHSGKGQYTVNENVVPATCTEDGTYDEVVRCSGCDTEFSRTARTVDELGHDYNDVVTAPTCTEQGYTMYTCSRCDDSYIGNSVDALGHTEVIDKAVAATCTKTGLTQGSHCSVCGTVITAQKTVAKKAHTYKTYTTKATTSKNGSIVTKCSVCGSVKSKSTIYYPKTVKLSKTAYTYNGKVQTPSVSVKDSKGNTLKKDTDYTVKYESGRKAAGKYTVTITFKGKYTGTKKLTYTIAPKVTSKVTASQTTTTITLKWNKVTGADGYRVYKYNTKTKKYEKLKDVTGTSLKISKLTAGTKYKYKVRAYTKDDGTIWGAYSAVFETATKAKTPTLKVSSSKKGVATLSWTNVSGESGYQVYYSTKKDSGYKKVASYKTNVVKGSKSKLKSGQKYYFKVRAYKKTASGTVYSAWSAVKSVKVK